MKDFRTAILTVTTLFVVGALCFFAMSRVKNQANWIVKDTLTGLSYAGKSISSLASAFNRLDLALNSSISADRQSFLSEVDSFDRLTSEQAANYQAALYLDEDRRNFKIYSELLADYQKGLREVISLIKSNRDVEAHELLKARLIPAFNRCMIQADKLLDYNVSLGSQRGREILKSCARTQFLFAVLGTLLFAAGFALAIFKYVFNPMFEQA